VEDTLIAGHEAKKLLTVRRTIDHWNGGIESTSTTTHYVASEGDSILSFENNQWELIFNFGASVGDSLQVYVGDLAGSGCAGQGTMVVEAILDSVNNGVTLECFSYRMFVGADQDGVIGHYFQKLGFTYDSPVKHPLYCDYPGSYFQPVLYCYSDDETLISPSAGCSQILSIDGKQLTELNVLFDLNRILVQNAPNSTLRIHDILGKELIQTRIYSDNQTVGIEHLPNGILIVSVETEAGRISKKVVKTN